MTEDRVRMGIGGRGNRFSDWTQRVAAMLAVITVGTAFTIAGCGGSVDSIKELTPDALILAFGNSITSGKGANPDQAYPAVLSGLIGHEVINAGQPGELTAAGLQRLPSLLEAYRPDLVILCHGGNDMLQQHDPGGIRRNLDAMVKLIKDSGADVILIAVPQPGIFLGEAPFYADLARKHRIPCESEILASVLGSPELKSDYVHPNPQGYRKMAEALAMLIKESQAL